MWAAGTAAYKGVWKDETPWPRSCPLTGPAASPVAQPRVRTEPAFHPFCCLRLWEAPLSPRHRRANGGLESRVAEARRPQLTPQEGTGSSSRLRGRARTER